MQAAQFITRRKLDQLEQEIISLASHINATEYEFLVLVREFDLRQGWKAYHFNNCAEWLDAHHVEHRADGGETSLDNMVLLCSTHHRLLHEGGFQIKRGSEGEWHFKR